MIQFLTQPSTSRYLIAAVFMATGVLHFIRPGPFIHIMPDFIPAHRTMVYISGAAEFLGGAGLLVPKLQYWAAWGLIVLLVAVFPANINMTLNAIRHQGWRSLYTWGTIVRLPLQFVLIYWVYWAVLK